MIKKIINSLRPKETTTEQPDSYSKKATRTAGRSVQPSPSSRVEDDATQRIMSSLCLDQEQAYQYRNLNQEWENRLKSVCGFLLIEDWSSVAEQLIFAGDAITEESTDTLHQAAKRCYRRALDVLTEHSIDNDRLKQEAENKLMAV